MPPAPPGAGRASAALDALETLAGEAGNAALQLEIEQPRRQLGGALAGAGDQLVEADRIEAERVEDGILGGGGGCLGRRRRRHARQAGERRQLVDDVVRAVDQLGALLDERMAAARLR